MRGQGREEKGREGRGGKRDVRRGKGRIREGKRRREGRGGLSGNVAEEAFCLKSAPVSSHADVCTVLLPSI